MLTGYKAGHRVGESNAKSLIFKDVVVRGLFPISHPNSRLVTLLMCHALLLHSLNRLVEGLR